METTRLLLSLLAALWLSLAASCTSDHAAAPKDSPPALAAQPPRTKVIGALGGVVNTGWTADWSGFAGTARGCMRSYTEGRFALEMPLEEGDRMLSLVVSAVGNGSADLNIVSLAAAPDGQAELGTVGGINAPNFPGGDPRDIPIELEDTIVSGGVSYWFEFGADQAGLCIGAVRLTYDRPGV